ncbi:MAG TPA: glycoside hydrolase family 3 N-terminal domain-containing protein [Desulfoprunum sp.]|nr:glycoside hydrolase family 3 N-terminal domain-containing protein [Desulfoprunum sp.]
MDLPQQIAQLLIVGFKGDRLLPDSTLAADLRDRALGGVILFDRLLAEKRADNNIVSATQTARLCAELQDCAGGRLLIAVDQEGGMVSRFKAERGFPVTASAGCLGRSGDVGLTAINAACTAEMLRTLGINLNLAPVVDLDVENDNPIIARYERSFAADPAVVGRHATAWITAHRRRRILTCLKHFPGHGSALADSHLGFVDISAAWREAELVPYRTLIADGMADLVMVGHLFNSRIDPLLPATLSPAAIDGLLRRDLGFDGAVITDDLQMRAITDRYGLAEACVMALTAGADILIIGNNLQYDPLIVGTLIARIVEAVRQGRLAEERIHTAWQRVRKLQNFIHR